MLLEYNSLPFQSFLQLASNSCQPSKTSEHYHLDYVITVRLTSNRAIFGWYYLHLGHSLSRKIDVFICVK